MMDHTNNMRLTHLAAAKKSRVKARAICRHRRKLQARAMLELLNREFTMPMPRPGLSRFGFFSQQRQPVERLRLGVQGVLNSTILQRFR